MSGLRTSSRPTKRGNSAGGQQWQPQRLYQHQSRAVVGAVSLIVWTMLLLWKYPELLSLWSNDPVARLVQQRLSEIDSTREIRVFGPTTAAATTTTATTPTESTVHSGGSAPTTTRRVVSSTNNDETFITVELYSREQQREFLHEFASYCYPPPPERKTSSSVDTPLSSSWNGANGSQQQNKLLMLKRFDELPEAYGRELWKYCVLYTGLGNVYWEPDNLTPTVTWSDILTLPSTARSSGSGILDSGIHANRALLIESTEMIQDLTRESVRTMLHHSFLQVATPKSQVCANMLSWLLDETNNVDAMNPLRLSETLGFSVASSERTSSWILLPTTCVWAGDPSTQEGYATTSRSSFRNRPCPMQNGYCCQVFQEQPSQQESLVVMAVRHPFVVDSPSSSLQSALLPYKMALSRQSLEDLPQRPGRQNPLVLATEELPFIATIREKRLVPANATTPSQFETPNFFDLLIENDCLPETKECFKCLKRSTKKDEVGGDCTVCRHECVCYCSALCSIRPPPKQVVAELQVHRPLYRKDPERLIPRIVHQTWFEPVDKEKYPNMSRLIESFRQSGWEYHFYDDETSAEFLSVHFPPQVREAYDAITPGAFKADLFRYCVLLIRGGLYVDMDILLESNLDRVIPPSVGFVTAQDEPGEKIGYRSCLWNGFLASAPGHPFLARTIENVVNNIRNRFTSVDYDDMLWCVVVPRDDLIQ